MRSAAFAFLLSAAAAAAAETFNAYTNHAGNVVSGVVVALDTRTATGSRTRRPPRRRHRR